MNRPRPAPGGCGCVAARAFFEQTREQLLGNAGALVHDFQNQRQRLVGLGDAQLHPGICGRIGQGVVEQIAKRQPHQRRMQLYGACRGQPLHIDARAQVGRNIVQHQLDQGRQIGLAGGAGLAACGQNRAGGQGVVQCAYHLLQHMLGAQQGPGGGRGIGQMQIFDGLERGLHGSRGIVQRLADFVRQQLQHLVVFAQHGRAPVQQGTQPVELARVLAAAAQLLVQGLQLLALACNDFATRIFASYVAELHQHLVPALGIGCAGRELYAAVALRTEVTGRMSSYSWCKPGRRR
jgi:hypothetical protein